MKKILSIILLVVSVNGLSQTGFPGTQSMANASTKLLVNGGLQAVRGIINGVFTDTTAANSDYIDFYNGAQIYTRSDRNFWLRDSVLNMWMRMAKYSETGSGTNIYNSNGFLDANRTLTGLNNTYSLFLDSLNTFRAGRNGQSRLYFNSTSSGIISQNGSAAFTAGPASAIMNFGSNALTAVADSFTAVRIIAYEPSVSNGLLTDRALTPRNYVDSLVAAAGGGSGTVNPGASLKAAYYPTATDVVDDWAGVEFGNTNLNTKITAQATTEVPLEIKLAGSQTANALNISSSAGTGDLGYVTKDGYGVFQRIGTGGNPLYSLHIQSTASISPGAGATAYIESSNLYATFGVGGTFGAFSSLYGGSVATHWVLGTDQNVGGGLKINNGAGYNAIWAQSNSNNPFVGINVNPARKFHVFEENATTNAITYLQRNQIASSGTPANGIGGGEEWMVETAAGNNEIGATTEIVTTDVTGASEDFDYVVKLMAGGSAATEKFRILSTGQLKGAAYGSGTFTGTPARYLAVEADGDVIEATASSLKPALNKGVFIQSPTSADIVDVWQTPVAITITSLKAILRGTTPSVTYNIRFGTDITSATDVFTADITCTSVTTGCSNSSGFNDATIPAGSFIWIITSAASGTINSIGLTINYTED